LTNENIRLLKLLEPTSNSLFEAKKSINSRIENFEDLNELGERYLQKSVITPLDNSIKSLNTQIYRLLNNIPIYIDYLKQIKILNVYDCAILLIELQDINRFKKFQNLLSYCGYSPKRRGNQILYQHLLKISNKLKKDQMYSTYYSIMFDKYKEKYPSWNNKDLDHAASRKLIKTFLKNLYKIWKFQENDR
jgi:hypothetical protein